MTEPFPYDWAEVYDDYSTGLPHDVEFYVKEAAGADGEVLELGCGTGRILIPIARAGQTVTGLDLAPPMLAICRDKLTHLSGEVQKRVTLVEADMRRFDLKKTFALILCPYRVFLHNLTAEDQLATLECVRRHLAPSGRFVMNVFDPRLDIIASRLGRENAGDQELDCTYFDGKTQNQVDVYQKRWYDAVAQVLHCEFRFIEKLDDGSQRLKTAKKLTLRWIYRWEMEHLFARAGFEVVELFGDFDRGPFTYGGEQVWIVRPKADSRRRD
jgi:SAM-dependent methyltransferase